jgi:hypothetical protein
MKKIILIVCMVALLLGLTGCKKGSDELDLISISYVDVRPQKIGEDETAWITVMVNNLQGKVVLIKILADKGIVNPQITSTTGNPVYIEYFPPNVPPGQITQITIIVIIQSEDGRELDRAEALIMVED